MTYRTCICIHSIYIYMFFVVWCVFEYLVAEYSFLYHECWKTLINYAGLSSGNRNVEETILGYHCYVVYIFYRIPFIFAVPTSAACTNCNLRKLCFMFFSYSCDRLVNMFIPHTISFFFAHYIWMSLLWVSSTESSY